MSALEISHQCNLSSFSYWSSSRGCEGRSESVSSASILLGDVLSVEVSGSKHDNAVATMNRICQYQQLPWMR